MKIKKKYYGTAVILCDEYNNLFNKKIFNKYKEIIFLKKKFKFILNQFKINFFKVNKYIGNIEFKKKIKNIIYILENKNILYKSILMIKNNSFNSVKSLILTLNNEFNKENDVEYNNNLIYIGNFIINVIFNNLILNKYINNNENSILLVKNISLLYIIKFIFLNVKYILIEDNYFTNNFKKKYIFFNNEYIFLKVKNIFNFIKNGDFLIIDYLLKKIYINPSSLKIKQIYNT
ncbi:hypothetical protein [endosymbiont of Pachyrhynchus infernalis]|uniref:hypothetical protein n=1 Tax=endosymbiont of Pachyrhynchus infernalis TaxID=1971488 RepID=UPI000DC7235A|nr:hypothetical protein [endosymbiont of Pachyrhynchus infernalis]BBA84901.1 phosphoenolpyruvate-protein phosphotransferase [endosymbiont of Pachyrhynchus infernalis]